MREERTALYRFYDAHENLLYVGITNDPWRRWRQHVQEKSWYPQVKHQAITWYDSDWEARRAEGRAIRSERPQFNVAGAIRPAAPRFTMNPQTVAKVVWGWLYGSCAVITAACFMHWPMLAIVAALSLVVPSCAALMLVSAPFLFRFACWVDRNFGGLVTGARG